MTTFDGSATSGGASGRALPSPSAVVAARESCVSELVASSPPQPEKPATRARQRAPTRNGLLIGQALFRLKVLEDDHVVDRFLLGPFAFGDDHLAKAADLHPLDGLFPAFPEDAFPEREVRRFAWRPAVEGDFAGLVKSAGVVDGHLVASLGSWAGAHHEVPGDDLLGGGFAGGLELRFFVTLAAGDSRERPFPFVFPDDHLGRLSFKGIVRGRRFPFAVGAFSSVRAPSVLRFPAAVGGGRRARILRFRARRVVSPATGKTGDEGQAEGQY